MSEPHSFLVIGTINSSYGQFDPATRLGQTLAALDSVRRYVPEARIVYVDNSNVPVVPEWVDLITRRVDHFEQLEHNLFSLYANQHGLKSQSEVNMLHAGMDLLRTLGLDKGRIFKLSGRYALTDQFDINDHVRSETQGRYAMAVSPCTLVDEQNGYRRNTMFMEQALISWDQSLHDHLQGLLMGMLYYVVHSNTVIEETMFQFVPHHMVTPAKPNQVVGVDTTCAEFDQYRIGEANV